ncbi:hypothetical protein OEZ85_013125 [Tetradesmus obliquus]|uniref:Uncharacterized protein n=1 Tax=Tetradesmus obliquus TaxID=3088 RepID=A0ABY8U4X7_TETOB|nr:hypothetical protein OEZ85_013125 [Tetradesmus obliquus]
MAEVLGTASNSAAAQQEVVAPQPQLSQRELEVKLEAAARASAAADANLARFLADHVPHHITAANASPAGIEGDSEPRAALMGGRQQHAHKANTAAAEGLSALQQATHAVKYIHEQHTSTAPQPELKPQTRRSWLRPNSSRGRRILAVVVAAVLLLMVAVAVAAGVALQPRSAAAQVVLAVELSPSPSPALMSPSPSPAPVLPSP